MATATKKKEVWSRIHSHFLSVLGSEDYEVWFSRAVPKIISKDLVVLEVPNKFFARWFREKFQYDLDTALERVLKSRPEIRYEIARGAPQSMKHPTSHAQNHLKFINPFPNDSFTFNNFVLSDSNAFAYYSCLEIINKQHNKYNPLFIFSDISTGKSHLLHAIGNEILTRKPEFPLAFIHADQFTAGFSQAVHSGRIHEFRNIFLSLNMLLFDDVHVLEGRAKTQEEFTFLVDSFLRQGKSIVLTSRKPPFLLRETSPRLKSILGWGLLAEIRGPEQETRLKILQRKMSDDGLTLPEDIIFFLAKSNDDMKSLFKNMARLQTFASINGGSISLSAARTMLRHKRKAEIDDIQSITAGYFAVSISELASGRRERAYTYPRQMAMYLCRKHTKHSYKKIGAAFGNRDHSTVIHSIKRIENELKINVKVQNDIDKIENIAGLA